MKNLRLDYFIDENLKLYQEKDCFHFNTDTKCLAKFMKLETNDVVLDIGTNNGALLLYADQFDIQKSIGVEILKDHYEIACLNQQFFKHPVSFYNEDIKTIQLDCVDVIVCNPPFFPLSETNPNVKMTNRQLGRIEMNLTLEELIFHAHRLLKSKGRFYFVHRPNRLNEIMAELLKNHFQNKYFLGMIMN